MCATGGGERGVGCLRTALPEHVLACAAARQDVEHIAALPVEAAEAEAMLAQEGSLLAAYECLAMLEGTSMKAQRALESGTNVNLKEAKNLNSYFQKASKQAAQAGGSASAAPTRLPAGTGGNCTGAMGVTEGVLPGVAGSDSAVNCGPIGSTPWAVSARMITITRRLRLRPSALALSSRGRN